MIDLDKHSWLCASYANSVINDDSNTNAEFLWRKARAYRLYAANHVQDQSAKKKLIQDAYNYSSMAVSSDNNNWAGHKWLAILIGEKAELEGSKAQLLASPDMKVSKIVIRTRGI